MSIRKVKLSDTQVQVMRECHSRINREMSAYSVHGSRPATFVKLHKEGLLTDPWVGSRLTREGLNVWATLQHTPAQRVFSVGDDISPTVRPESEPITDKSDADIQRTEGVQRIMDKVNAKKSFSIATPQDTEAHFIGSGALTWEWWDRMEFRYDSGADIVADDWSLVGIPGVREDMIRQEFTLNHESILSAIRKIARIDQSLSDKARGFVSLCVIRECQTWIFKGPDECDFDAPMADEVMQFAVFGVVTYA